MILYITLIMGFLIGIYFSYKKFNDNYSYYDVSDYITPVIVSTIVSFVIGFILCIMLPMDRDIKKYNYNIVSLQINNGLKGDFISITDQMKYNFFIKEDNDTYKMMSIDAKLATIKYTNTSPKITVFEVTEKKDSFINKLGAFDCDYGDKTYIIEIPENTVINKFNLEIK